MTDILMPALSPTMEEGTLAKWHVKVGDAVKSGDVIAEIETDKATMEVEAVDEGVIDELLVAEGTEEVKVNTPIARLKGEGASAQQTPPTAAAPPAPPGGGRADMSAPPPLGEGDRLQGDGGGLAAASTRPEKPPPSLRASSPMGGAALCRGFPS